ncbi:Phosphoglycerate mutase family [Serinicoccus hydrothermalis]|uniref:Phosphoglycerate mutase family n=1 Tax=Serinicoccus hydrothermalis TaxID=1758689 RepID=A0A1B1N7W4_9MICO|nr:histidine phosphatase family protein [Serinicoccus hydrothermalis]ANS77520.1 Phosphoglycerate mutase family [Serinicoccus hydrothermalis]
MTGRALVVEADGGSRGNPGVAGYGALVRDAGSGDLLAERAAPLGKQSNNVAEYTGLIEGLRAVLDLDLADDAQVEVRMDSKLVVEQMAGRWKIKHEDMKRLALQARRLVDEVRAAGGTVGFTWIPRGDNAAADKLSNDGMDGHTVRRDHVGGAAGSTPEAGGATGEVDTYISDETVPSLDGRTRLVLVRHGVTDFTVQHRMDGRGGADPSLNAEGRRQAQAAAEGVAALLARSEHGTPRVVTSSLARARQTGQLLAGRLGVETEEDRDWDEQGFGDWDGRAMPVLAARAPEDLARLRTDRDFARPGGESRRQLDQRVGEALERAVAGGGTVVVATHRVVIMSVLCRLLGVDHERGWSIATGPASMTAIEFWPDGGVQVAFVNDTQHLHDLP